MKRKLIIQIVICLTALFALGGVCGYALSGRETQQRSTYPGGRQWAERWLERRMAEDFAAIAATPDQEARLRPIYSSLLADVQAIQQESAQKVTEAFKKHNRELRSKLSGAQLEALQSLGQERISRPRKASREPTQP